MNHTFLDIRNLFAIIIGIEFFYTFIVVILCFAIYLRTKEIYDLTRHKGVKFFRNTFLFLGLAYLFGFIFNLLHLSVFVDVYLPKRIFAPIFLIPISYLSTVALLNLAYSTVWKKIKSEQFLVFANLAALVISIEAFITRSPIILTLTQIGLLAITIIMGRKLYLKSKKFSKLYALYILVVIFWMINMFGIGPKRLIPFEFKVLLEVISVVVFYLIYCKVTKWVK